MSDCNKCIHYPICDHASETRTQCSFYEERRPHGKWKKYGDKIEAYDIAGHKTWGQKRRCTNCHFIVTYIEDFGFYSICPNCGADMSKLQANGGQVKNELNRVSKELNSEIENSKSEIVPDYRDGWRLKEGEAK